MILISVKQRSSKRERTSDDESAFEQTSKKSKRLSDIESEFDGMYIYSYVAYYLVDNSYVIMANNTLHMCVYG